MQSTAWLSALETTLSEDESGDELATALVVLAAAAGQEIHLDDAEERAATRRAVLLLAAGGDPNRGLDLQGRAVTALADDLRDIDRQIVLEGGLRNLAVQAKGLPYVSEALHGLMHAPDIAWRAYSASILALDLAGEGEWD